VQYCWSYREMKIIRIYKLTGEMKMLNKLIIPFFTIITILFASFSINASASDLLIAESDRQVAQVLKKGKKRIPGFAGQQVGALKKNNEGLDPRIIELESQLAASTDAQQTLNDKVVELEGQLKTLNDRNIDLEGQLAEANDARQSFVEGISQLEGQLAEANDARQSFVEGISQLES
jgi:chromosome segregation ATPase